MLTYRLYRRGADLERLVKVVESSGAQVHTVATGHVDLSTASGRMVARMLGAPLRRGRAPRGAHEDEE